MLITMPHEFEKEAHKYNLLSLRNLQEKRKQNVTLFEQSIKNERGASQQEEVVQTQLENKLQGKLSDTEREWILSDLPKLKSTRASREQTIALLKAAIMQEYDQIDIEEKMIHYLEKDGN